MFPGNKLKSDSEPQQALQLAELVRTKPKKEKFEFYILSFLIQMEYTTFLEFQCKKKKKSLSSIFIHQRKKTKEKETITAF